MCSTSAVSSQPPVQPAAVCLWRLEFLRDPGHRMCSVNARRAGNEKAHLGEGLLTDSTIHDHITVSVFALGFY